MSAKTEFERFERLMVGLISVPHSEIKKQLDAEKAAKKRKKVKQSSASARASNEKP